MTTEPTIPDETLMAFADGELDDHESERVAHAMEASPALAERVEMFMASRERVRGAYASVIAEPVPERLLQAALGDAAGQRPDIRSSNMAAAETAAVVPFERPVAGSSRMAQRRWLPVALAASVAAVAAGLVGYIGGHGRGAPTNAVAALFGTPGAVAELLTATADGERRELPVAGLVASVAGTYRMADQRLCRTLDLNHAASGTGAQALACRGASGWRLEVAMPREPDNGTFRPAAAGASIEAVLDAGGASDALAKAEVDALIRSGWR
jgi:negative regulator of sigma E activity